jgi:hypothetical protein
VLCSFYGINTLGTRVKNTRTTTSTTTTGEAKHKDPSILRYNIIIKDPSTDSYNYYIVLDEALPKEKSTFSTIIFVFIFIFIFIHIVYTDSSAHSSSN